MFCLNYRRHFYLEPFRQDLHTHLALHSSWRSLDTGTTVRVVARVLPHLAISTSFHISNWWMPSSHDLTYIPLQINFGWFWFQFHDTCFWVNWSCKVNRFKEQKFKIRQTMVLRSSQFIWKCTPVVGNVLGEHCPMVDASLWKCNCKTSHRVWE